MHNNYEFTQITYYDHSVKRNRLGRWAFFLTSLFTFLLLPGFAINTILSGVNAPDWIYVPVILVGAVFGGKLFSKFLPRYIIIVPLVQGYVTVNQAMSLFGLSGSTNVIYGQGWHISYPWESRSKEGNFSLEIFTLPFNVAVPGREAQINVSGSYQFRVALPRGDRFIGIAEETIENGLLDIIKAEISALLPEKTSDDAKRDIQVLQKFLEHAFGLSRNKQSSGDVHRFEESYGIESIAITISNIVFPESVQKSRNAIDKAMQVMKGVATMYGITPERLKERLESEEINYKDYNEMVDKFLAQSGDASMDIKAYKISGLESLDRILELLGGQEMRLDEKMRRSVASGTQERAETKEKLPKSFLAIVYASCGFLGVVWLLLNDWQNDLANQAGDSKSGSSGGESASSPQISIDFSSIIGIRDSQWYQPVKDHLLGWEPWLASLFIFFLVMFIILTVFNIINQFTLPKEKRYGVFENNWAGWGIIGVIIISFVVAISHHSAGDVGKHGVEKEIVGKATIRPIAISRMSPGDEITSYMHIVDVAKLSMDLVPIRLYGQNKVFWGCPEMIEPLTEKKIYFQVISGAGSFVNEITLTENSKEYLLSLGIMKVNVKWKKVLAHIGERPCTFLN